MTVDPLPISAILDWGVKVLFAVGGVGGITALFMVRAQKRKVVSESGKTDAEADSILADASAKKTDREAKVLDMYERGMAHLQGRLDDAEAKIDQQADKIDRLTEYVERCVSVIRQAGAPVPPMPRKMSEAAHAGNQARTDAMP